MNSRTRTSRLLPLTCLAALVATHIFYQPPFAWCAEPDPQMQAVLTKLAELGGKPIEKLSAEEARKQPSIADAAKALMKEKDMKPEEVADIDETPNIKLTDTDLDAMVYYPAKGEGPFPIILYIHGGGWVLADLKTYDASARALCNAAGAVVVSTHYRQAPEYKFPTAHLDTFGAYQWVVKNANRIKGDVSRIALVGESAGGNMAAAISLMAKHEGAPLPIHQVLIYPVADATNLNSPSYSENAAAKPLNKPMMEWFFQQILEKPEDAKDSKLSLVLAGDKLNGMPPTTIITAQIDPLRSDGEALAAELQKHGVPVTLKNYEGVTHEFFGLGSLVDKSKEAQAFAGEQLKAAFAAKK